MSLRAITSPTPVAAAAPSSTDGFSHDSDSSKSWGPCWPVTAVTSGSDTSRDSWVFESDCA
jgi:hypothetical protein